MAQDIESTRVMAPPGGDRTLVAGVEMPPMPSPNATQMGVTVACPVCKSNNPGLETYCIECGFLLTSVPGSPEESDSEPSGPVLELVESASGRTFRLKEGVNTVGRESCDILLIDGTVSRRHAQINVEGGALSVTDLGSTNGSQVDGNRLSPNQPTSFGPGAVLRFGNSTLTLPTGSSPVEATIVSSTTEVAVEAAPEAVSEQTLIGEPGALTGSPADAESGEQEAVAEAEPEPAEPVTARFASISGGRDIEIRPGTITIGRRAGNTIVIDSDPYVSGSHAEIVADESGVYLVDVGSTNGTVVNGAKLVPGERQPLVDGDEINLGQATYRFESVAAAPPPASEPSDQSDESMPQAAE